MPVVRGSQTVSFNESQATHVSCALRRSGAELRWPVLGRKLAQMRTPSWPRSKLSNVTTPKSPNTWPRRFCCATFIDLQCVCVYIYKPLCLAREEQQQLAEKKAQQAKNSELRTTMEAACTVLKTQETHAMTCGDACSLH